MPFLKEFLAEIFVRIIFEGFLNLLSKGYSFFKTKVLNLPAPPLSAIEKLEKDLLDKDIRLLKNINIKLKKGMKGVVAEIINEEWIYAEFRDLQGNLIEIEDEAGIFELKMDEFELILQKK